QRFQFLPPYPACEQAHNLTTSIRFSRPLIRVASCDFVNRLLSGQEKRSTKSHETTRKITTPRSLDDPQSLPMQDRKARILPAHLSQVDRAESLLLCNAACDANNVVRSDNPAANPSGAARCRQ